MAQENPSTAYPACETDIAHHGLSVDHRDALLVLGHMFFQHRQSDKALVLFETLYVLFPKDTHVRLCLAYAHLINGRYDRALELAEHCDSDMQIASDGKTLPKTLIEIRALWALHRKDEARQQFQTFINGQRPR